MRTEKEVQDMLEKIQNSTFQMRARNKEQRANESILYAMMQTLAWAMSEAAEIDKAFKNRIERLVRKIIDKKSP